jgi:hypothetical protein
MGCSDSRLGLLGLVWSTSGGWQKRPIMSSRASWILAAEGAVGKESPDIASAFLASARGVKVGVSTRLGVSISTLGVSDENEKDRSGAYISSSDAATSWSEEEAADVTDEDDRSEQDEYVDEEEFRLIESASDAIEAMESRRCSSSIDEWERIELLSSAMGESESGIGESRASSSD